MCAESAIATRVTGQPPDAGVERTSEVQLLGDSVDRGDDRHHRERAEAGVVEELLDRVSQDGYARDQEGADAEDPEEQQSDDDGLDDGAGMDPLGR